MNIEIPPQVWYRLLMEAAEGLSDEEALRINRQPILKLISLPYPGLQLDLPYDDYEVVSVRVKPLLVDDQEFDFIDVDVRVRPVE